MKKNMYTSKNVNSPFNEGRQTHTETDIQTGMMTTLDGWWDLYVVDDDNFPIDDQDFAVY